jgi:hypothetical protein
MSRFLMMLLCLLSALNIIALVLNLSQVSTAAVGGMSYQDLLSDPDFTRAVKSIAVQGARPRLLAEGLIGAQSSPGALASPCKNPGHRPAFEGAGFLDGSQCPG